MKRILTLAVLSFAGAVTTHSQTVTPIWIEGKTGGKGVHSQFTVINKGITPLPVTVEPRQLQMVDGKPQFGPVQTGTQVELKDTSAVIAPKSNRTFDYRVTCPQDCMVLFMTGFVTGKNKDGVTVKLWIPSSAYLCSETKGCRERTKKAAGLP